MAAPKKTTTPQKHLLHMVLGGELDDVNNVQFRDLNKLDVVGFYPNYAEAYQAWLGKARETIDNAQLRYFIVHLHEILNPAIIPTSEDEDLLLNQR